MLPYSPQRLNIFYLSPPLRASRTARPRDKRACNVKKPVRYSNNAQALYPVPFICRQAKAT